MILVFVNAFRFTDYIIVAHKSSQRAVVMVYVEEIV